MATQYKRLPSELTEDVLRGIAEEAVAISKDVDEKQLDMNDFNTAMSLYARLYEALWQAAPEVEQEPIGECDMNECMSCGSYDYIVRVPESLANLGDKVYLHPQPTREPLLSDDELMQIVDKAEVLFQNCHSNGKST